jgi:HPt (histidine-containing phosphotransfer) domain-containing protein
VSSPEEVTDGDAAAGGGATDPLDQSVLMNLRELQEEGEPDILAELAELFLSDALPQLEALREATESGDASSIERVAHTLKGSCGNMGAIKMSTLCAELEDLGHSRDLSRAPVLIERLEAEYGRVRPALEVEMERSSRD